MHISRCWHRGVGRVVWWHHRHNRCWSGLRNWNPDDFMFQWFERFSQSVESLFLGFLGDGGIGDVAVVGQVVDLHQVSDVDRVVVDSVGSVVVVCSLDFCIFVIGFIEWSDIIRVISVDCWDESVVGGVGVFQFDGDPVRGHDVDDRIVLDFKGGAYRWEGTR